MSVEFTSALEFTFSSQRKFLLSYYKRETAAKPQKQPGTSLTYV